MNLTDVLKHGVKCPLGGGQRPQQSAFTHHREMKSILIIRQTGSQACGQTDMWTDRQTCPPLILWVTSLFLAHMVKCDMSNGPIKISTKLTAQVQERSSSSVSHIMKMHPGVVYFTHTQSHACGHSPAAALQVRTCFIII